MEKILNHPLTLPRQLSLALGIAVFVLLMVLAANVYLPLPFTPVPATLQTLVVLASAALLGRKAALSQILYLALGAAGLPVFAGAWGGWARIFGPTGGYLLGFVLAAFLAGWFIESQARNSVLSLAAMAGGALLILAVGTVRLWFLFKIDLVKAFYIGMLPFIPGDILKTVLAWLAVAGWRSLNRYDRDGAGLKK